MNKFGEAIRYWRRARGMSQMDLALRSDISVRHLSFLENGRAEPGEALILRLATTLGVTLKARDGLLRAAGYSARASMLTRNNLPPSVSRGIQFLMQQHEPFPAYVMNACGDLWGANVAGQAMLGQLLSLDQIERFGNAYLLYLSEDGLKPYIENWEVAAAVLLYQLYHEYLFNQDPDVKQVFDRVIALPGMPSNWLEAAQLHSSDAIFRFSMRYQDQSLHFFTMLTTFGTPQDTLVQNIRIEQFFPDDALTEQWLRGLET